MRIVTRPYAKPMRCAAMPHIGQTTRTRWIDTGAEMQGPDDHVYLSEVAIGEAARIFGWAPGGELRRRDQQIAELRRQVEQEQAHCALLQGRLNAIDVIESEGFRARKKPGRPRKEDEVPV